MTDPSNTLGGAAIETGSPQARQPIERLNVDGLEVIHRRVTAPLGVVVFVHGAMDRASSFRRVMRRLADFDTVAYDRRGYAGSLAAGTTMGDPAHAPEDELDRHARDLGTITDWARSDPSGSHRTMTTGPIAVVGHSLGGLIALVASEAPALITPDALCAFEAPLPWLDLDRATSGSRTIDVANAQGPEVAAEFFYRSMVGDTTWERIDATQRTLRRSEGQALVGELRGARRPRNRIPLPPDARRLHVGRGDTGPAHLRSAAETLAQAAGNQCDVIEGAPHGAHLSTPGKFGDWVRRSIPGSGHEKLDT